MPEDTQFADDQELRQWYAAKVGAGSMRDGNLGTLLNATGIPCYTCLRVLYTTDEVHNTVRSADNERSTFELQHRP